MSVRVVASSEEQYNQQLEMVVTITQGDLSVTNNYSHKHHFSETIMHECGSRIFHLVFIVYSHTGLSLIF